ncbi:MAG: preprotein translocase subunit SecE [Spirochaetota bacterium]|nr:preprotein translocase subunit SecE [Spirochaetota bacterium]
MKQESKIKSYIRESIGELHKVTWPKKDEVVKSTLIVIVVVLIISGILGAFDAGMQTIVEGIWPTKEQKTGKKK